MKDTPNLNQIAVCLAVLASCVCRILKTHTEQEVQSE